MKKKAQKIKTFCLYFLIILLIFVEAGGVVSVHAKENKTAFEKRIINTNIQNKLDEDISSSVNQAEGDIQTNSALLSKSIIPHSDKTTQDSTTNTVKAVSAQTWNSTHQITYFQGNKPGAVSISFDDGLPYQAQDTNGVSQLNARGLKGTFFVVTDWISSDWRDSWATWQSVAAQGHEVASHTVTHPRLTTLSDNQVRWELSKSQSDINQNIPGQNTISLSYPNTAENSTIDAIADDYYVASRVAWAKEGAYLNYYQPFSDEYGSYKTVNFNTVAAMEMDGVSVNDPDFNSRLDRAILNHAWFNLYFHTINDAAAFGNVLDYVQGKQSFWIDTFGNVSRYMKERLNSTIQVITDTPSEIRLQIVMGGALPLSIYNVPLTLRSTVPASWSQVVVQHGSAIQTITPIIEGSDTVIYYNALPDGGDIVLIPLNPVLGLVTLNPASVFVGGSSFTLTITGTNFIDGSIVRWNNSDRVTTYINSTQLAVSVPASDIASIGTAEVRVFNSSPSEGTSNQLYFAITAKPITVTVIPGQSKTYGGPDPIFTYTSSDPSVTFTGALSRASAENIGAFTIQQGTLAVVDSNYAITSFVPANFAITPKPITITVNSEQAKVYGDADPILSYTSSDPTAAFTGALSRAPGENIGTYVINQGTVAVVGNNYTIASINSTNFTIAASTSNANLSNLVFSTGTLSPVYVFASGITTYTQSVAYTVTSLTVTPTAADATATIKVNGTVVESGSASGLISLAVGSNTITTIVTAQDDTTTKTYTVTVTRAAPSTNANLSGLAFSTGVLTPAFTSGTTTYTQLVAYNVTSLTVTPTAADATATIKVNGTTVSSGSATGSIALAVGETVINTVVTAQDETTTKTYTVIVTRAPNPAKDITAFSFTSPTATGVITGTNIAVTVPFGTDVTALVATFTTTGASVGVGASTQVSGTTPNNYSSPVTYTVFAADSTKKDYSVSVVVAANPAKMITAFSFANPTATGIINETAHTIAVTVPYGTDVTALVAAFTTTGTTVKVGNTTQVSKTTANNFTSPVTYTVTAADLTTQDYTVTITITPDIAAPIVSTIVRANPNPTAAFSVDFTVAFSAPVTGVDASDFMLTTTGGVSGAAVSGVSGTGSSYIVSINTGSGNGTIRLDVVDNNSIVDTASNPLGGIGVGDGDFTGGEIYDVEKTAPTVISSVRVTPSPTNLASVQFTVTFSESVTGVNTVFPFNDFTLTASGVTGASITSVTPASGTTYTVSVNTGSGAGTIRLNVVDDNSIVDAASNLLGGVSVGDGNFISGQVYNIDKTSPAVLSSMRVSPNPTPFTSAGFTVTFSESVTGVDLAAPFADFSLTNTGVTGASITSVTPVSGTTYTVTVNTGTGNGTIRLNVMDNNSIVDAVSNPLGGAAVGDGNFATGEVYTITKPAGGDTTGVFRPSNGLLYLKNANTTGFADVAINYGTGGDYPIAGDWNGDGTATIGIYRNGSFYLRNSNTLGFSDIVFAFGTPGDQPVAGDWDGDGVDTIGVYSNGQFLLRNSNSAGTADMSFFLGNPGDVGIAGDWNGDGMDTTGVFRPSNGIIFLKNVNTTGFADIALNYGLAGDMPVTGDWNNDGIDTIGVYRNAQFLLRNSNTIGFAEIVFGLGNPGDMPISGNWDGIP